MKIVEVEAGAVRKMTFDVLRCLPAAACLTNDTPRHVKENTTTQQMLRHARQSGNTCV